MTFESMAATARREIGYRESGTNDTKFNRWNGRIDAYPHGGYGYPWCHSFLSWVANKSGNGAVIPKTAGCLVGVAWFRQRGQFISRTGAPRAGDLVYYGAGGGTHVELVTAVASRTITTIGGNTSGSLAGAYFNGDGVYQKTVSRASSRIYGYGRPKYAATTTPAKRKEALFMANYVRCGLEKEQPAAHNTWTVLRWKFKNVYSHVLDGPARFYGNAYIRLHAPAGTQLQAQFVETTNGKPGDVVKAGPIVEDVATDGDTFMVLPMAGSVAKGRDLVIRINQFAAGKRPVPVVDAECRLFYEKG